jgi:hypothetical protein
MMKLTNFVWRPCELMGLCVEYESVLGYDAATSQKTLIFIDNAVEISNLKL